MAKKEKKKKEQKMYKDQLILAMYGDESYCSYHDEAYSMEDLNEFDEWMGFIQDRIYEIRERIHISSLFHHKINEIEQEELKDLNYELQVLRTKKREAVRWLKEHNLFNVGEEKNMEVSYS